MPKDRVNKWKQEEPSPSGLKTKARTLAPIPAPVWLPTRIGKPARDGNYTAATVTECLRRFRPIGPLAMSQFLKLMTRGQADNKTYAQNFEDFEDLCEVYEGKLEQLLPEVDADTWSAEAVIMAAWLGADPQTLPAPDTWVSTATYYEEGNGISARSRDGAQLRTYEVSRYGPATPNGQPLCMCGDAAAYIRGRQWGDRGQPAKLTCPSGGCRYQITSPAYGALVSQLGYNGTQNLPILFCTAHPSAPIEVRTLPNKDNDDVILNARCTWFEKTDKGRPIFCPAVSDLWRDEIGPCGALWRALSSLQ